MGKLLLIIFIVFTSSIYADPFDIQKGDRAHLAIKLSEITHFDIDNSIGGVDIYEIDGGEVELEFNNESGHHVQFTWSLEDGRLKLKQVPIESATFWSSLGLTSYKSPMSIGIPKKFLGDLNVEVYMGSGIQVQGRFANGHKSRRTASFTTNNTNIAINELIVDKAIAKTNNGKIHFKKTRGTYEASANLGEITATENIGDLNLYTKNGHILTELNEGSINAKSDLGNITFSNPGMDKKEQIGRISGTWKVFFEVPSCKKIMRKIIN